jgi:hypothetical protein
MHALGGEVFAGDIDVLARHLEARALAHGVRVVKTGRDGDHHPAFGDLQVDGLVEAVAAVLEQNVPAGDAEIGGTVLHIGRRVGGANDDHSHVFPAGRDDQPARGLGILERLDPGCCQQRQGLVKNPALGQSDGDAVHGFFPAGQSRHSTAMKRLGQLKRSACRGRGGYG